MPSHLHEGLVELFHERPALAAELLAGPLGVPLPQYCQAQLNSGELTDFNPTEYRADTVVVLTGADGPVLAIVVEIQLRRDPGKRFSWPVYLTTLRARLRCPAALLVLCADDRTADWCAAPISIGHPGMQLCPLMLGPNRVPVVTDPAAAAGSPELTVLSAMAHGAHPDAEKVLQALLTSLQTVDDARAVLYTDLVLAALPAAARARLEELMSTGTYEYQSDFVRRHYGQGRADGEAQGRAEGEVNALLQVLAAREIAVPAEAHARITGCTDLDQLNTWIRRAVHIDTIDELFT